MGIYNTNEEIKKSLLRDENGRRCTGKAKISITGATAQTLLASIPNDQTKFARISIEADATSATQNLVMRFWESGDAPTATDGQPVGHLDVIELTNRQNLCNFKIIATDAAKTHTLQVLFYR